MLVSLRLSADRTVSVNPEMVAYVAAHDGDGRALSRVVFGLRDKHGDPHEVLVEGSVEEVSRRLNGGGKRKDPSGKKS